MVCVFLRDQAAGDVFDVLRRAAAGEGTVRSLVEAMKAVNRAAAIDEEKRLAALDSRPKRRRTLPGPDAVA
ncbi:hypothetical protein KCMC57_up63280 [Kitasatospora sp. CMC57]|uniref:Uncharacterized protein n=1 Tax=Kitasatospora sp. CMC57 TaxID=3231513 RepID=A0AB33K7T0_9ACTN